MEDKIRKFVENICHGGYGGGYGEGYGDGYGDGFGGTAAGGYGDGYCQGNGNGYGDGDGSGGGAIGGGKPDIINGNKTYYIDGVATIITRIKNNVARGYVVNRNLTLQKCVIVKNDKFYAHGENLREAQNALTNKIFAQMNVEQKINEFIKTFNDLNKKYPNKDFYVWHNRLTGSCEYGRKQFAKNHGIDIKNGKMTVDEFLNLTKESYGGEVIGRIIEKLGKNGEV